MNHKRRRAKSQRAGCYCGGKLAKALGPTAYGSNGRELRLMLRKREAE